MPAISPPRIRRYRFGIWLLSALLTLLVFWFLGYVVRDIGDLEGPDYAALEQSIVPQESQQRLQELERRQRDLEVTIKEHRQMQEIYKTSMEQSGGALSRLVELHKLSLESGVAPAAAEQQALAEAEQLYLARQREFQQANEQVATLNLELQDLSRQIESTRETMSVYTREVSRKFQQLQRLHQFKVALFKLLLIVPVLFIAAAWVFRHRDSKYLPIFTAVLVAALWRVIVIMHAYFPREWFRYIIIASGIAVVLWFLILIIRTLHSPRPDLLARQIREAYNRRRCPACGFPIKLGALANAVWTAKGPSASAALAGVPVDAAEQRPYHCPACGGQLYATCSACGAVRASLLPFCDHCGAAGAETGENRP